MVDFTIKNKGFFKGTLEFDSNAIQAFSHSGLGKLAKKNLQWGL